ncbi:uncharacterized protein LOC125226450 isoform X2 [Leguminivora glycinivorella]|uniref:uncharacterized protein LOC125226450 isoform X2 n=1 Tax=Leguminivora glycinivorella TaxID=1035111 RepID=UPI00200D5188|nr:uncharacterized protein LOC125226450 isoform X2 [Leguminivora glycinivorella]
MGDRARKLVQLACSNKLETAGSGASVNRFSMTGPSVSTANENISCYQRNNEDDDDSSDLDETQIDIAAQMHNIVIDDDSTADSNDETALFGSDYSDEDPTYVPDSKDYSPQQIDTDFDFIPESPNVSYTEEDFFMVLIDEVLDRVWISVEGLDHLVGAPYVLDTDSENETPQQNDYDHDIIIPESPSPCKQQEHSLPGEADECIEKAPSHVSDSEDEPPKILKPTDSSCNNSIIPESSDVRSEVEDTVYLVLENILDRVWSRVKPLKRRKQAKPSEWKVNIAKKRKMEGLPYVTQGIKRPAKVPKPIECDKCQFKCTEQFSDEERCSLCRNFYSMDFRARKNFILSCLTIQPVKTRKLQKTSNKKERSFSKKCFFQKDNDKIQVCQKFFMATLCISVDVITDAVNKKDSLGLYAGDDQRGKKSPPNKTKREDVQQVKNHIESFPVMDSHYCRKDTKKKYLYPDAKSVVNMHGLYVDFCKENNENPVSESKYRHIFNEEYNYSFYSPKKDLCNVCSRYKKAQSKEKLEEEYQEHIQRKTVCQNAKDTDKARANVDETFMSITMDLQAVLQIPYGGESLLYYMRKLVLFNFTIYEASLPNNAYCLCWSEINGNKGSCEIGSCLYYYLSQLPETVTELSIFSDTCSGQNRNQYISALLIWAVQKIDHLQIIEQKFLESGHSHMEVDSMHAAIEHASKNLSINSVSDWKNVFKFSRTKKTKYVTNDEGKKKIEIDSYKVKEFKFNEMLDLKKLSAAIMNNKNKDTTNEAVNWLKIKRIRYVKGDFKIYFNYDMSEDFRQLDISYKKPNTPRTRAKRQSNPPSVAMPWPEELEERYSSQLPISIAKKKDLETMCRKQIIPEEYHGWIRSLKTFVGNAPNHSDEE